jgi:glycosyltransferase involved in cell wall biosynthesis
MVMVGSDTDRALVSIGMPIYNGEGLLRQALDSLLAQDYENFELIISDNASTDKTQEICLEYAARDDRIHYYRNDENIGPLRNFNRAFELSGGQYFMWAAHDDRWERNFISRLMEAFRKSAEVVLSCCDYDTIYHLTGRVEPQFYPPPSLSAANSILDNAVLMLLHSHSPFFYGIYRSSTLASTRTIRRRRDFDFQDLFLLNEMCLLGKVQVTPEVLFHAGVKEVERPPKSFSRRRFLASKFAYGKYYVETVKSIMRSPRLRFKDKAHLLFVFTSHVLNLIWIHESIPRPLREAIRQGSSISYKVAEKFFPVTGHSSA